MFEKIDNYLIDEVFQPISWLLEEKFGWKSYDVGIAFLGLFTTPILLGVALLILRAGLKEEPGIVMEFAIFGILCFLQALGFLVFFWKKRRKLANGFNIEREDSSTRIMVTALTIIMLVISLRVFVGGIYSEVIILFLSGAISILFIPLGLYFLACTPVVEAEKD